MVKLLIAPLVILAALYLWVRVQFYYQRFSELNPGLGPYRASAGGCGANRADTSGAGANGSDANGCQCCGTHCGNGHGDGSRTAANVDIDFPVPETAGNAGARRSKRHV